MCLFHPGGNVSFHVDFWIKAWDQFHEVYKRKIAILWTIYVSFYSDGSIK